jgi:4-amino-4-deoxy-L-arabinose transferase-like glycosyltransferase
MLSLVTLFWGAGALPLLGPDEPRYSEIAREMWASGDYVSPRLCGKLWFEKPVLLYWGQALGYTLLGVNEGAARLPCGVAALGLVLALAAFAGRWVFPRAGIATGVVAATSLAFVVFSHAATTDMMLAATLGGALLCGFIATRVPEPSRATLWLGLMGAFTGASMLAKGLVGPLFVVLILGAYCVWTRPRLALRPISFLLAFVAFALVAATWYLPVYLRHGNDFIHEFFVRHHFQRYTTNEFKHPQPFYFFPAIALIGMLPWTLWVLPAFMRVRAWRPRDSDADATRVFALLWAVIPIAFFSISESKLPSYILPAFPALALLAGDQLSAGTWLPRLSWRRPVLAGGSVLVLIGMAIALFVVWPSRARKQVVKPLSLAVAERLRPGEKIAFYKLPRDYAPMFYTRGRVYTGEGERDVFSAESPEEFLPLLKTRSIVVITRERDDSQLARFKPTLLVRMGDFDAVRLESQR